MRMSHKELLNRVLLAALCLNEEAPHAPGSQQRQTSSESTGELCSKLVASTNGKGSRKEFKGPSPCPLKALQSGAHSVSMCRESIGPSLASTRG